MSRAGGDTSSTRAHRSSPASNRARPTATGHPVPNNASNQGPLTEANLAAHNARAAVLQEGRAVLQKWLDDEDDQLIRQRIAEFWAELLQHDALAVAIEAIVENEELNGNTRS